MRRKRFGGVERAICLQNRGDDDCLKVGTVAFDGEVFAIKFFADISLYCFWGDHGTGLNLTD